jgi:uncharacterized protein DUF6232
MPPHGEDMSRISSLVSDLTGGRAETVEPEVPFFTVTPRTIRFGHGAEVYALRNVTRIGKFEIARSRMPILVVVIAAIAGLYFLNGFMYLTFDGLLLGLPLLAVAAYGLWTRLRRPRFAFGVQVSSGGTRFLSSKDEKFIDRVLALVTSYIEEQQDDVYHINMEKVEITRVEDRSIRNSGTIIGNLQTGDAR